MRATVVALHGFLGDPSVWEEVRGRSEGVSWVCPWLPGHGPAPSRCAGDFEAVVDAWLDGVVGEGVVLVGYSMGARLALSYALRHPGRVLRAVLLSATPGLGDEAARAARRAEDDGRAEALVARGVGAFVEDWEAMPLWNTQVRLGAEVRARHRARRRGHTAEGLAAALGVLGTGSMPSYGSALREPGAVPTRWLAGAEDTKFVALAEGLRGVVESVEVVPGAGHDLVLEAPEAVAEAVREALERCAGPRPTP